MGHSRKGSGPEFALPPLQLGGQRWCFLVIWGVCRAAGWGWGCSGKGEGGRALEHRGSPLCPLLQGLWPQELSGPLPQPEAQAKLSAQGWTSQHSCWPGPLPPSVPKLRPRLRRPGPSSTLGEPARCCVHGRGLSPLCGDQRGRRVIGGQVGVGCCRRRSQSFGVWKSLARALGWLRRCVSDLSKGPWV